MTSKPASLIQSLRDDLRDRRNARAEYRSLKAALATYNRPADIDDLLLLAEGEGPDVVAVRDILTDNRRRYHLARPGSMLGMRLGA